MTLIVTAAFAATASTVVDWGRELNSTEKQALINQKASQLSAGIQAAPVETVGTVQTTYWSTLDAANAYVTFVNTLSPVSAVASAV